MVCDVGYIAVCRKSLERCTGGSSNPLLNVKILASYLANMASKSNFSLQNHYFFKFW